MKTFSVVVAFLVTALQPVCSQFYDDFSDGDIATNPEWYGAVDQFAVNAGAQLQLASQTAGISWLSAPFTISSGDEASWEFWLKQSFSPSGGNYGRIYLMSDQADVSSALNGYYLQFGEAGSEDAIELFRQTGTARTSVCRGTRGAIATAFEVRIRVTKSSAGDWSLFVDYTGGTNFTVDASGRDDSHASSSYFGILSVYTVTNASRFFYDDITANAEAPPDTTPPLVDSARVTSLSSLRLFFSEKIDPTSARDTMNYIFSPYGRPRSAVLADDNTAVELQFSSDFRNGYEATLEVIGVRDFIGNTLRDTAVTVLCFVPQPVHYRDVIITEIFCDPSPQVGLPETEFAELLNRSPHPVELKGWRISDGTSTGVLPEYLLLPGGYLIVSTPTGLPAYAAVGHTVAASNFPTLNNSGDGLVLTDAAGNPVDSLRYRNTWYRDEDKSAGGWTLERIDPENACDQASNWSASTDVSGGTPGKQNSVHAIIMDTVGPALLQAYADSDSVVHLRFDEGLALTPPRLEDVQIVPAISVISITFHDDARDILALRLSHPLDSATAYVITVVNVYDCPGNPIREGHDVAVLKLDDTPPFVLQVSSLSDVSLLVTFSERIARVAGTRSSNYTASQSGSAASAALSDDLKTVTVVFNNPFPNGIEQMLIIEGISDLAGNVIAPVALPFLFFAPAPVQFRDVIVTEVLADPNPPVGLPEAEYIELFNRSANVVDLGGWSLGDGTNEAVLPNFLLLPGDYVVVTSEKTSVQFSDVVNLVSTAVLPSLNNAGDALVVRTGAGQVIDSLHYRRAWYGDDEKADGGWSLELIDPQNVCLDGANWTAAEDPSGGTPGRQNSVYATRPDNIGPKLLTVNALAEDTLLLLFDEKLDHTLPSPAQFIISPERHVRDVAFADWKLRALKLILVDPLSAGEPYTLDAHDIYDCAGNLIHKEHAQSHFLLPQKAATGDIIINEVLFNPRPAGVDFVELYNLSQKAIDLKGYFLRNVGTASSRSSVVIAPDHHLLYPGEYRVFVADADALKNDYAMGREEAFTTAVLPALNDDGGSLALISADSILIDSMRYSEDMHSPFLRDPEGVSLEKISPETEGYEGGNWRSASADVGFATPGYKNSNFRALLQRNQSPVTVEPPVIQAQSAGLDFTRIHYALERGGFIANVNILDAAGRVIRHIAEGHLLGAEGFFRWDGDADNGSRVRTGYYMVCFQVFDAEGMVETFRAPVALF